MKHARRYLAAIAALSMISATGCSKDEISVVPDNHNFVIELESGSETIEHEENGEGRSRSRADELNETLISHVDVFFFDNSGACLVCPARDKAIVSQDKVALLLSETEAQKIFNKSLKLYLLANSQLPRASFEGKTYDQVRALVQTNSPSLNPTPFAAQDAFLMDGETPVSGISTGNTDLGKITLKRAASKITATITDAGITGYTAIEAHARMDNYLDKTMIGDGFYYPAQDDVYLHSGWHPIYVPNNGGAQFDMDPFYSYCNDWETEPAKESYVTIRVKWRQQSTGIVKEYFYRIPFNYIPPGHPDGHEFRLRRNYIYNFKVNITTLGGLDPETAIDLNPYFELRDWTTHRIEAKLDDYDYLLISENHTQIYNLPSKALTFKSSKPIQILDMTAYYETYVAENSEATKHYYSPSDQTNFPKYTISETNKTITITSPIPQNYVPVYISFTVKHKPDGLSQKVSIIQYPRIYITYKFSEWDDLNMQWYINNGHQGPVSPYWFNDGKGDPVNKNFNLYTVNILATEEGDEFVLGEVTREPARALNTNISRTKRDANTNNIVSPQFVIGSSRGVMVNMTHETAEWRCFRYNEGEYARDTWRIPTTAEMKLMSKLQNDPQSAIKGLFAKDDRYTWFTAQIASSTQSYWIRVNSGLVYTDNQNHGVRCIRDVWQN